jgi:uncharacterized membrane protein YtjA (UPF0391 family)
MLYYALVFFVIAILAVVLAIRGVAGLSVETGYFLAVIAIIFLVIAFISGQTPTGNQGPLP